MLIHYWEVIKLKCLSETEMRKYYGGALSWIAIMCIAGGCAAIWKVLFSGRGSFSFGPFRATWGR